MLITESLLTIKHYHCSQKFGITFILNLTFNHFESNNRTKFICLCFHLTQQELDKCILLLSHASSSYGLQERFFQISKRISSKIQPQLVVSTKLKVSNQNYLMEQTHIQNFPMCPHLPFHGLRYAKLYKMQNGHKIL